MRIFLSIFCLLGIFTFNSCFAQELIIYPSNDQSKEQQNEDEGACFIWARENSGYDPLNVSSPELVSAPTTATQTRGGGLRGAARGAIIGGIVNGSDGAKDGASIGVLGGLSRQSLRNQQAESQQQQQTATINQENTQAVARAQADRGNYNRYYATCLEGRGYAVN